MKTKKTFIIIAVVLVGVILLASCGNKKKGNNSNAGSASEVKIDDGDTFTADEIKKNKLTVLNIWATWCPPCVAEIPHLQDLNEIYKDKGVEVVGVLHDGVDDDFNRVTSVIDQAKELMFDANASYRVILPNKKIMQEYVSTMQYFPTTFMLNSDGNVVDVIVGKKDLDGWKEAVDAALKKI